jgi:hypothetical protein
VLHLIIACGVLGVTALAGVVISLQCEVVVLVMTVCVTALAGVVPLCITLGGETYICTLGVASLISHRVDIVSFLRARSGH